MGRLSELQQEAEWRRCWVRGGTRFTMRNLWSAVWTRLMSVSPVSESGVGDVDDVFVYWVDGVGVCSGVTFVVRVDESLD